MKYSLERDFSNLWIQGEIASCKPYASGHIYLTLKDDHSELSAVIFSQHIHNLSYYPKIGQQVTVKGNLSLYSQKGKFQFLIRNIYPVGQGELWLAYEALKQRLEDEGLFLQEKKKKIPKFPKKIGIITSSEGAALQDILQILNRRAPHVYCLVHPVPVQGNNAGDIISTAIDTLNQYEDIDALILGRGGGSLEDLWCFNDEKVIRSIYASKIPIISAIGHETDITLSDYVSDCSAPTPSAAAELVSEDRDETMQLLDHYSDRLTKSILRTIIGYGEKLDSFQKRHGIFMPHLIFQKLAEKLNDTNARLKQSILHCLKEKNNEIKSQTEKTQLLDPMLQLKRGFAIVTDKKHNIVFSPNQLDLEDIVNIRVDNGRIITKVIEKRENDA